MFGLFKKRQLPKRVLLLSALPDNEMLFARIAEKGESDFLSSLKKLYGVNDTKSLWNSFRPSAKALQSTFKAVESRGGTVIRNFSLQDVMHIHEYDIVILLAHHSDDSDEIEIGGQMVRTIDFVNAIPSSTRVIMDLTSCYSAYLIPKIKAHVPASKIIGIEIETKLPFRLYLLEKVLECLSNNPSYSYLDALQKVLTMLPEGGNMNVKDTTPEVRLGGKLQSTVYAPKSVFIGNDFIVSVFLHTQENCDNIEIIAKATDERAEKRNSKRLSARVKKGDRVDFQLSASKLLSTAVKIDKRVKGFIWDGEINNVEFVVSVSDQCSQDSFVGIIKICVNKEPVGDMVFKTTIVSNQKASSIECADFDFLPYDKKAEMDSAKSSLLKRLSGRIDYLNEQMKYIDSDSEGALSSELEMCRKCQEILEVPNKPKSNNILKVFISSTSDMKNFRQILKERVEACEMYADMYENWGQGNDYPRDMCCKHVLQSDIFVCILGPKYGFVEPMWDKSMTEIEYRIALNAGLPILIYIKANYKEEMEKLEDEERQKSFRQEQLIDELKNKRLVGIFPNELGLSLLANSELLTVKHFLLS